LNAKRETESGSPARPRVHKKTMVRQTEDVETSSDRARDHLSCCSLI
jgi:hypothetical protein